MSRQISHTEAAPSPNQEMDGQKNVDGPINGSPKIDASEIEKCIAILNYLNKNTDLIFEIPKEQRTALIQASGRLSRPDRDEFSRRKKDAKKAEKRKQANKDRAARK